LRDTAPAPKWRLGASNAGDALILLMGWNRLCPECGRLNAYRNEECACGYVFCFKHRQACRQSTASGQ
jgi:hypothetical protein